MSIPVTFAFFAGLRHAEFPAAAAAGLCEALQLLRGGARDRPGVPNSWMVRRETPIYKCMIWGYHYFRKLHYIYLDYIYIYVWDVVVYDIIWCIDYDLEVI